MNKNYLNILKTLKRGNNYYKSSIILSQNKFFSDSVTYSGGQGKISIFKFINKYSTVYY